MTTNRTHGHSANPSNGAKASPTYSSWQAMLKRCRNPNEPSWQFYGKLGVTVCERWNLFENFLADMGERPAKMTIDRHPDKSGNYELGNCRWATSKQQARNRRSTKLTQTDVDSIKKSVLSAKYLAEIYSVSTATIYDIRRGDIWA